MNTIYWITRLDAICVALGWLAAILVLTLIGCFAAYFYFTDEFYYSKEKQEICNEKIKIIGKRSCIALIVTTLLLVFIPSTKEAFAIYGIGGTIDYIKNNDKTKQLPDKVINALDRYVDTIANDSIK